ncbi:hypothetical protein [Pedococcus bigeumensis]|uniref:Uncharacterized protein n=1 Tax=Pedococcus bigeumensis TaxID=433644 RepID=A0A502D3B7_9MICO|nr:hypothetical protein [Pedococcus bigeumensis]TPG19414.1 hypothetical protein EAH86_02730 [Pedococcus bigeumensis]
MAHTLRYGIALSGATVAVLVVDLLPNSDDAGPVVLLVLLATAFALGTLAPSLAWATGLALGMVPAAATFILLLVAPDRLHHLEPPGLPGAASLLVLCLPALLATYAGAGLRSITNRPGSGQER